MVRKKTLLILFALLILALPLLVLPVYAGGWAEVKITRIPDELYAGRPFTIEFMVLQHGNKPVHELSWNGDRTVPIEPVISLGSAEAQAKLTVKAQPAKQPGLFMAEITLPGEGEYYLSIDPNPLGGISKFEPLNVLPESAAPAAAPVVQSFSLPPMFNNTTAVITFAAGIFLAIVLLAYRTYQDKQAA
jgi:hypothetical protein